MVRWVREAASPTPDDIGTWFQARNPLFRLGVTGLRRLRPRGLVRPSTCGNASGTAMLGTRGSPHVYEPSPIPSFFSVRDEAGRRHPRALVASRICPSGDLRALAWRLR